MITNPADLYEVETHMHSWERWFGVNPAPTGTSKATRIGDGNGPFVIDAGDDTWGAWVEVFGTGDTPADPGNVAYNPHRILITDTERAGVLYIQLAAGTSGAAGLAALTYTEFAYFPNTAVSVAEVPVITQTEQILAGHQLWARTFSPGQNTGTVSFYLGVHEYARLVP